MKISDAMAWHLARPSTLEPAMRAFWSLLADALELNLQLAIHGWWQLHCEAQELAWTVMSDRYEI